VALPHLAGRQHRSSVQHHSRPSFLSNTTTELRGAIEYLTLRAPLWRSTIPIHAGAGTEPLSQPEHVVQPSTRGARLSVVTHDLKAEARDATGKSGENETIPS